MRSTRKTIASSFSVPLFTPVRCSSSISSSTPSIPRDFTVSSSTFQPNIISLTNQVNRTEQYRKFGGGSAQQQKPQGIPRLSRLEVRPISILHETPRVTIAGRNFCNGFGSNQYLVIHRETHTCILIDASDDWPDDWIAFMKSSRLYPTHIFLTHCHVDNVLSLNAFLHLIETEMTNPVVGASHPQHASREPHRNDENGGRDSQTRATAGAEEEEEEEKNPSRLSVGIMWNPAEKPWVENFQRACQRYGRTEEMSRPLPLLRRGSVLPGATFGGDAAAAAITSGFAFSSSSSLSSPYLGGASPALHGEGHWRSGRRGMLWGGHRSLHPSSGTREVWGSSGAPMNDEHTYHSFSSSSSWGENNRWERIGRGPPRRSRSSSTPPMYSDILLSSATNRSTSFYSMGPHTPLHYLFTPGHSPGHTMLHMATERLLFTGDVLGYQHVGRVDLPWGVGARLGESILSLESFPDDTVLLPGHGRLTTLGRERRYNKALQVLYAGKRDQPHREMPIGFNTGYL